MWTRKDVLPICTVTVSIALLVCTMPHTDLTLSLPWGAWNLKAKPCDHLKSEHFREGSEKRIHEAVNKYVLADVSKAGIRQGDRGKQLERRRKIVLIVVSFIAALFTWRDFATSLLVKVFLIYTYLSRNIFHAFTQHSCCWSGFNSLVPLPCSVFGGAQGPWRSRHQRKQRQEGKRLVVLLSVGAHVEELHTRELPAPEAGPGRSSKVVTFHRHFWHWAFLVLVLLGPSGTSSCSATVAILQEAAALSVCLSSDVNARNFFLSLSPLSPSLSPSLLTPPLA